MKMHYLAMPQDFVSDLFRLLSILFKAISLASSAHTFVTLFQNFPISIPKPTTVPLRYLPCFHSRTLTSAFLASYQSFLNSHAVLAGISSPKLLCFHSRTLMLQLAHTPSRFSSMLLQAIPLPSSPDILFTLTSLAFHFILWRFLMSLLSLFAARSSFPLPQCSADLSIRSLPTLYQCGQNPFQGRGICFSQPRRHSNRTLRSSSHAIDAPIMIPKRSPAERDRRATQ